MRKATRVTNTVNESIPRTALTAESRENQMICLAMDLAEQRLRDGSASSQEVTHFLKLGSSKERLEKDILEMQKELVRAKTEALQSAKKVEELYAKALTAMKTYSGNRDENDDTL